jgi:peptide/nickel transport system substrate-binding protein
LLNIWPTPFLAAGVPVEVNALPWENTTLPWPPENFDLYYGEVRLTADWNLTSLLGSGGSLNYGHWSDAQTDQLLSAYPGAADRALRHAEPLCVSAVPGADSTPSASNPPLSWYKMTW